MNIPAEFEKLPKFLIADDDDGDRNFVIHCHYPRFIMEFIGSEGIPHFIDDQSEFIKSELETGREPAQTMARLMREAGDFFSEQISGS